MSKNFNLVIHFPFLRKLFNNLFPKILDFTSYPFVRGNLMLLMEERNTYFRYAIDSKSADKYNLGVIDTLFKNSVSSINLKRLGASGDGGYLVPNHFSENSNWITIGLGYNFKFENELAKNGCSVWTFDHTVARRPRGLDKRILYFDRGWGSTIDVEINQKLITLDAILNLSGVSSDNDNLWCLKFDIEGNEWGCITQIGNLINKPAIIACEIHGLTWGSSKYHKADIIKLLNDLLKNYIVCFLHGNNYAPYFRSKDYGIYDIVELTLIRKDLVKKSKNTPRFPTLKSEVKNNVASEQMPFGRFK